MMIKLTEKDERIRDEVLKWMEIGKDGYPNLRTDAPDNIKKKYKYLEKIWSWVQ